MTDTSAPQFTDAEVQAAAAEEGVDLEDLSIDDLERMVKQWRVRKLQADEGLVREKIQAAQREQKRRDLGVGIDPDVVQRHWAGRVTQMRTAMEAVVDQVREDWEAIRAIRDPWKASEWFNRRLRSAIAAIDAEKAVEQIDAERAMAEQGLRMSRRFRGMMTGGGRDIWTQRIQRRKAKGSS